MWFSITIYHHEELKTSHKPVMIQIVHNFAWKMAILADIYSPCKDNQHTRVFAIGFNDNTISLFICMSFMWFSLK